MTLKGELARKRPACFPSNVQRSRSVVWSLHHGTRSYPTIPVLPWPRGRARMIKCTLILSELYVLKCSACTYATCPQRLARVQWYTVMSDGRFTLTANQAPEHGFILVEHLQPMHVMAVSVPMRLTVSRAALHTLREKGPFTLLSLHHSRWA